MQAPRIPKMFGIYTKRPTQFEYTPRYYDERKEKLEKRIAQIKKEVENKKIRQVLQNIAILNINRELEKIGEMVILEEIILV